MGLVGPKTAATGVPIAAATCIGPESFVTRQAAACNKAGNTARFVRPDRSAAPDCAATRRASACSSGAPISTTGIPSRTKDRATVTNDAIGQRLVAHRADMGAGLERVVDDEALEAIRHGRDEAVMDTLGDDEAR